MSYYVTSGKARAVRVINASTPEEAVRTLAEAEGRENLARIAVVTTTPEVPVLIDVALVLGEGPEARRGR